MSQNSNTNHVNNSRQNMLESLKRMAMQKLAQKMMGNVLSGAATQEAASEGASALMDNIKGALGGGQLDQVKDLFSSGGQSMESNGLFQNLQTKMTEILQAKGMSAEDAAAEAQSTTPDIINGLKEKFESSDEADKEFDLGAIGNLLGGGDAAGNILGKVKDLF